MDHPKDQPLCFGLGLPGILVSYVHFEVMAAILNDNFMRRKQPLGIVLRCRLYSLAGFCHQLYLYCLW